MKVKNLVFFGVAAAILSTASAMAEANPSEKNIVTSKYYVDLGLDGKQDTISDLATIRSGAAAGATALQPAAITQTVTAGNTTTAPSEDAVNTAISDAISGAAGNYQEASETANQVSDGDGGWKALGTTLDTTAQGYEAGNAVTAGTIATALGGKQDTINDLATIRSGAAAGATALQPAAITQTVTAGNTTTAPSEDAVNTAISTAVSGATNGNVIPARTGDCAPDAANPKNCALVADAGGNLVWRVMAGN